MCILRRRFFFLTNAITTRSFCPQMDGFLLAIMTLLSHNGLLGDHVLSPARSSPVIWTRTETEQRASPCRHCSLYSRRKL